MDKEKRALIAEGDFATRWRMKRLMEPHIHCDIAVNGDEVLRAFELSWDDGTPYDLMLVALDLPGQSFLDIVTQIRKREEQRGTVRLDQIKFVTISFIDTPKTELNNLATRCEGNVVKPLRKGDFLGQLHSMGFLQS